MFSGFECHASLRERSFFCFCFFFPFSFAFLSCRRSSSCSSSVFLLATDKGSPELKWMNTDFLGSGHCSKLAGGGGRRAAPQNAVGDDCCYEPDVFLCRVSDPAVDQKKTQQQQQHQSALCDSGLGLTHRHKKDITVTQLTHPCLLVAAFVFIFFLHCVCVCVFGQATSKARGKRGEREREKREEREERRGQRIIYTTRGKAHSISASKGSTASLPAVSPD